MFRVLEFRFGDWKLRRHAETFAGPHELHLDCWAGTSTRLAINNRNMIFTKSKTPPPGLLPGGYPLYRTHIMLVCKATGVI